MGSNSDHELRDFREGLPDFSQNPHLKDNGDCICSLGYYVRNRLKF
jgi:hypothetical protein